MTRSTDKNKKKGKRRIKRFTNKKEQKGRITVGGIAVWLLRITGKTSAIRYTKVLTLLFLLVLY